MKKIDLHQSRSIFLGIAAVMLASCAPVVVGGAAVTGMVASEERGLAGSITDAQISTKIRYKLYQKDPDLHRRISVIVQNGEVMLTGAVPNNEDHTAAVEIAWSVEGVTRVIDNIAESQGASVGTYASDSWITTTLKSTLVFDSDVQSRNYTIKTVSGQVYLMGIAQDQAELDRVINHARNTNGVTKVISYVKIKNSTVESAAEHPVEPTEEG